MTTTAHIPHFNAIEYVKKLRAVNFTQEQAEIQALEMEQVVSRIAIEIKSELKQELHADKLATKKDLDLVKLDLQKEIVQSSNNLELKLKNLEIKLMAMYGAGFLSMFGMLAKGFHWW